MRQAGNNLGKLCLSVSFHARNADDLAAADSEADILQDALADGVDVVELVDMQNHVFRLCFLFVNRHDNVALDHHT